MRSSHEIAFGSQVRLFDAATLRSVTITAHPELRTPLAFPGWYFWWAREQQCAELLGPYFDSLLGHLDSGEGDLLCYKLLYVGIAPKSVRNPKRPPLKSRVIDWHLRQKHTLGNVQRGFLSTLRQSISALACEDMSAEAATNQILDEMKVELIAHTGEESPSEINAYLCKREQQYLKDHVMPLNLAHNHRPELIEFKHFLSKRRKAAKQKGLETLLLRKGR